MPLYGPFASGIYGETRFGAPPKTSNTTTMSVAPQGYQGLIVQWLTPGTPGTTWSQQMLLRSSFGTPTTINDGVVLLDETAGAAPASTSTSFVDAPGYAYSDSVGAPLRSGRFYYYALFVYDTTLDQWVLSASAQGLVLTKWGFGHKFVTWTPQWYFGLDAQIGSPVSFGLSPELVGEGPLFRFLQLLGFEQDWIRSEVESLFLLTSGDLISGLLLPYLSANYGMGFEPELGMARSRVLAKNAVHLYKERGTLDGIAAVASAYTGFGCEVTLGPNLEIQLDDSAFDQSAGHWTNLTACTLEPVAVASLGITPQHTSYAPAYASNVGLITAVENATPIPVVFSTCNPTTAPLLGIPVDAAYLASLSQATPLPAPSYELSGYFRPYPAATPAIASWVAQLDWYAANGALLGSTVGSAVQAPSGVWTMVSVSGSPPAGAVTFGRTFKSSSALAQGEQYLFDAEMVQLV